MSNTHTTISPPTLPEPDSNQRGEAIHIPEVDVEIPLSLQDTHYSYFYFGVKSSRVVDSDIKTIEDYVANRIKEEGLNDSVDSYTEIIQKISEKIGLSENTEGRMSIQKIAQYIKLLSRPKEKMNEFINRKKNLEKAQAEKREKAKAEAIKKTRQKNQEYRENLEKAQEELQKYKSEINKKEREKKEMTDEIKSLREQIDKGQLEKQQADKLKTRLKNLLLRL